MRKSKSANEFGTHRTVRWLAVMLAAMSLVSFTSCRNDMVYSRFVPISCGGGSVVSQEKWHMDSVARFDYSIDDAGASYSIIVYIRHNGSYPYQNMWLFAGDSLCRDTLEFYLADDRGQWLGERHHGFIEMPVLLEENKHFADTGAYYLEIQHGMRDTLLRGVTDVGVEIIKN